MNLKFVDRLEASKFRKICHYYMYLKYPHAIFLICHMISINEKANEYNASVYIYHLTLGSRYKNPKRKPNTKGTVGLG